MAALGSPCRTLAPMKVATPGWWSSRRGGGPGLGQCRSRSEDGRDGLLGRKQDGAGERTNGQGQGLGKFRAWVGADGPPGGDQAVMPSLASPCPAGAASQDKNPQFLSQTAGRSWGRGR